MTEDMPEKNIEFTVSGYKDLVGNEGVEFDNNKITTGFKKIKLDHTAPTITDVGPTQVRAYDANPYKFVRKKAGSTTDVSNERVGDNTLSLSSGDGVYTITVTDAAGNVTKHAFIKYLGKPNLINDVKDSTLIYPIPEGTNNNAEMNVTNEVNSNLPEDVQEAVE